MAFSLRLTSMLRNRSRRVSLVLPLLLLCALPSFGDKKPAPAPAGTLATAIRETILHVSADESSERLANLAPGREMVIVEKNGDWLRVFANTDEEQAQAQDAPIFGAESAPPPISGWTKARGIVAADTPNGDEVLFGVAANTEELASEPHPPKQAAQQARLLYRRLAEMFPQSRYAGPSAYRSADIRWQLEKQDAFSRPSAHEKENYLRQQLDEDEMKKILKKYPGTKWADLAAYDLLDNKICGDWQGSEKCPERESELYLKYAEDHPDGPKAAEALYKAAWRQASAADMYSADNEDKKSDVARGRAKELAARIEAKYPLTDYAPRAAGLIYKLEQGIPVYGVDRE